MNRLQLSKIKFLFIGLSVVAAVVVLAGLINYISKSNKTAAISATEFRDGNIISDEVFYDKNSMSASDIQNFLDRSIPNCDVWGTGRAVEWGRGDLTRAQYAATRGWHGPPYVCLNRYHENPNTKENSYSRGGGAFAGGISAAQIIYNAAQENGISPKVLLTLLKKESSGPLTSDNWPIQNQYRYAMGYACPDSGPGFSANCSSEKSGFYNQMSLAAWQLKYYKDHYNSYRYKLGWNDIQYSPNPACGTKRVYIENIATLSLYIYTPYVPNQAALQNYPGTAHCGAYGNRNFFMFYNEMFGSTHYETPEFAPSNTNLPDESYTAKSSDSGLAIDVAGGEIDKNGARLQIYKSNNSSAQKFNFERTVDGYYVIKSPSGKVLDVAGGNAKNGTPTQLYSYNGTCAQKWSLQFDNNGKYEILSACNTKKALDITGGNVYKDGARLQIWSRNYSGAQKFSLHQN